MAEKAPKDYELLEEQEQAQALNALAHDDEHEEQELPTSINTSQDVKASDKGLKPVALPERVSLADKKENKAKKRYRRLLRSKRPPKPKGQRNPNKDKQPLNENDMGLASGDFLADRRVSPVDLETHMESNVRNFPGSNTRKPREFTALFDRGMSTKQQPKMDLTYNIEMSPIFKRRMVSKILLRNMESKSNKQRLNAEHIIKNLDISKSDAKELIEEIQEDNNAHENPEFIEKLRELLPKI